MNVTRTIPIILDGSPNLRQLVTNFGEAKRLISNLAYNNGKPLHRLELHKQAYQSIRHLLGSQMACSAIRSVSAAYVAARTNKKPAKKPFRFVKNSAIFLIGKDATFKKDGMLSIATTAGRQRLAYKIPEAFQNTFNNNFELNSIQVTEQANGSLKATIALTLEVPDAQPGKPIGVDLNAGNAVVAINLNNECLFISGRNLKNKHKRTRKTTSRLQRKLASYKAEGKSTRSVRRTLKRLSRRRSRRTLDFCRVVGKRLVEWAGPSCTIVLENLKFDRRRRGSKALNRKLSEWPYGLTRDCIRNRAELVGIMVTDVNPAYTSQSCSKCGNFGVRNRHKFTCPICLHAQHADINAATNIRNRHMLEYAQVGCLSINPEAQPSGMGKPPALAGGN